MEVVNHQGEREKSKLSLNEKNLSNQSTSPLSINENEDSLENKLTANLKMTNKFRRVFPSSGSEMAAEKSSLVSQNVNENNTSNDSSCVQINSNENSSLSNDELGSDPQSNPAEREGSPVAQASDSNCKEVGETNTANSITDEVSSQQNSGGILETSDGGLKIHMVTTLDGSDVFVEAPSGPLSPEASASNPLESDKEETSDSIASGVSDSVQNAVDKISPQPSTSKNVPSEKDEQGEVITGDKTISSEYVKTNLNSCGEKIDKDHGYLRKANENQSGNKETGKKILKVIYPKKKIADFGQLKINKVPSPSVQQCIHCSALTLCEISIDIGGSQCFLCSEDCLKLHKTEQINALQRKNCTVVPTSDQQDSGQDTRLCVNCDTNVSLLPEDKILSWETMEFCNEDCLGKYQTKMWSFCTACKKDVPPSSMGKYCVRFGHEVKQFCSGSCLEDFKKGIKVCCYCQKDLSENDEGFLAPIGEKGQFRDFCSQICLDEYYCMSNNIPGGGLKVENCGVCNKNQLVQVQVLITPNNTVNLCSVVCLAAFKFVNSAISGVPCFMCKKYFDKSLPSWVTVYYENELLTFCSKSCMNINILAKRKIVACNWCKVKKYNFDMIRRKSGGLVTNWCSVNCMALYQVSVNVVTTTNKRKPCTQCKKMELTNYHLTMSDATARNFCSLECVNAFQTSFPSLAAGIVASGQQSKVLLQTAKGSSSILYSQLPSHSNESRPSNDASTSSGPVTQSNVKKPEIKVIGPASMNGHLQAALLSPGSSQPPVVQAPPPQTQIIRNQILVIPQTQPLMVNAKVQVRPNTCNKSVTVKCKQTAKSSQTERKEEKGPILVPIPVPIFIPCPMAMYSIPVPTPVPVPVPIPVPIFIPTTKGTAEEILADIKRIQEQMPGNPYEAELIMMAEMAESQKNSREESNTSVGDRQNRQKRPASDSLDVESSEPPEKKRKEVSEDSNLGSTIHHLAVSRLPLSLKETLGVSAWKHYAAQIGEITDLLEMRSGALAQALRNFVKNAKIPSGGHYTPDQKYYLLLGSLDSSTLARKAVNIPPLDQARLKVVDLGRNCSMDPFDDTFFFTSPETVKSTELSICFPVFLSTVNFKLLLPHFLQLHSNFPGIQYYLEENGRIDNIFYDKLMDPFIEALDEDARSFQNMFAGSDSIITRVEEEHLWESKQLGPNTPYTLLATLIYFNTKYFNLTTVEEHKRLSFKDVIKHWRRNTSTVPPHGNNNGSSAVNFILRYITPDSVLESNPKKNKVYEQESNLDDPYRCPIHLYEFYLSKCPESVRTRNDLFYLSPERSCSAESPIWFSTLPLPDEIITRTLNRFKMVKEINLSMLSSL